MATHAFAAAAVMLLATPDSLPAPEPEQVEIMVEVVSEPDSRSEEPREARKGDRTAMAAEEMVAPEEEAPPVVPEPEEEELAEPEKPLETIPVPVRKPKPERKKTEEKPPEKPAPAKRRGLEDEPRPDFELADEQKLANNADASPALDASRGAQRDVKAEQRWFGKLSAHLERRKRYPRSAQSKRREGTVTVRFFVASDGAITQVEIITPSGVAELDQEVLDLMRRASPAPVPPPDVNAFVTVPINFTIKN